MKIEDVQEDPVLRQKLEAFYVSYCFGLQVRDHYDDEYVELLRAACDAFDEGFTDEQRRHFEVYMPGVRGFLDTRKYSIVNRSLLGIAGQIKDILRRIGRLPGKCFPAQHPRYVDARMSHDDSVSNAFSKHLRQ